jgi:hypothetical protein
VSVVNEDRLQAPIFILLKNDLAVIFVMRTDINQQRSKQVCAIPNSVKGPSGQNLKQMTK